MELRYRIYYDISSSPFLLTNDEYVAKHNLMLGLHVWDAKKAATEESGWL